MKKTLKESLINTAKELQVKNDPSHDFNHVTRVLNLSLQIAKEVHADEDILVPAVLFHDIIVHKKNSMNPPRRRASRYPLRLI